jgi:hypothetical protein
VPPTCLCRRLNAESNVGSSIDFVDETYGKILINTHTHTHTVEHASVRVRNVWSIVCADCAERLVAEANLSLSSSGSLGL